jgi:hypothetical protein
MHAIPDYTAQGAWEEFPAKQLTDQVGNRRLQHCTAARSVRNVCLVFSKVTNRTDLEKSVEYAYEGLHMTRTSALSRSSLNSDLPTRGFVWVLKGCQHYCGVSASVCVLLNQLCNSQ